MSFRPKIEFAQIGIPTCGRGRWKKGQFCILHSAVCIKIIHLADVERVLQFQTLRFYVVCCAVIRLYKSDCYSCEMQNFSQVAGIQENTTGLFCYIFSGFFLPKNSTFCLNCNYGGMSWNK